MDPEAGDATMGEGLELGSRHGKGYGQLGTADDEVTYAHTHGDEVDIEAGHDEPEEPAMMDWAEAIALVDVGCWATTKTGTAGATPDADAFPWLTHSPESFVRILWDLSPSDYRLVSFLQAPKDAYDPDEYLHASQIMIADITEVMLELEPSTSFRVYLEGERVIRFTPHPQQRGHAAAWVDALYAAIQLQEIEKRVAEQRERLDAEHAGHTDDLDALTAREAELLEVEAVLRDLRLHFFEDRPEMVNKYTFGREDRASAPGGALVTVAGTHETVLGGHASARISARLDFSDIYAQAHNTKKREEEYNACCTPM